MVKLICRPNTPTLTRDQFRDDSPPFSVALDGYVYGPTWFEREGPRANFNHHEEVDRLSTRATCAQVLLYLRQGFLSAFRTPYGVDLHVFTNDCDEDVCLSVFLLRSSWLAESSNNARLNRLVSVADMMDTTGGSYGLHGDLPFLGEMAWINQPYREFRSSGGLYQERTPERFERVISDVGNRIMEYLAGGGGRINLDMRYDEIRRFSDSPLVMVREHGTSARSLMFSKGIRAFLSVQDRDDGRWAWTVGRAGPWIDFDIESFLARAQSLESVLREQSGGQFLNDSWGGGPDIGGSPRSSGSLINPEQMAELVRGMIS